MNDITDKEYIFECNKCKMIYDEHELRVNEKIQVVSSLNFDIALKCNCGSRTFKVFLS